MWRAPDLVLWFLCSAKGQGVRWGWAWRGASVQGLHIKLTQDASRGQGAGGEVTVWHSLVYVEMGPILGHRVMHRDKKKTKQNKIKKNRNSNDVPRH